MTRCFFLCLTLVGCRYLAPVSPQVTPGQPALLSSGGSADPTRQPGLTARRCVVECGVGQHCDERSAACVPDGAAATRDGGLNWMP